MKYAVVNTDNMFGTDVRSGLVSVRYMGEGSTPTAIENGCVVKLNGLMPGEREIYKGVTPTNTDKIGDIVLLASPEVDPDERNRNLDQYINVAGKNCKGFHFHPGDVFSVTKEALVGLESPAKDNIVELTNGTKLNVVAEATGSGVTVVGTIHDVWTLGRYTYYAVKVN